MLQSRSFMAMAKEVGDLIAGGAEAKTGSGIAMATEVVIVAIDEVVAEVIAEMIETTTMQMKSHHPSTNNTVLLIKTRRRKINKKISERQKTLQLKLSRKKTIKIHWIQMSSI